MKKTVLAAAAVVLAVLALLAGCGKERKTPTVRIGVALYQQEDTFLATVVQNLEQLARAEEQAAELTRQQLRQAEQTCGEMKQQAQSRLKQAAAMIVEKVVND